MNLDEVRALGPTLSPWAHLATIRPDNTPDVTPVHPCWEGDTLWLAVGMTTTKARNVATNPNVAIHWQVTEQGDGLEVWGTASCHDDLETKRRLWTGVFDYDLSAFAPGGPDDSPGTGFMAIKPTRAIFLKMYGMQGTERWSAGS